jgi:hypothetical protein
VAFKGWGWATVCEALRRTRVLHWMDDIDDRCCTCSTVGIVDCHETQTLAYSLNVFITDSSVCTAGGHLVRPLLPPPPPFSSNTTCNRTAVTLSWLTSLETAIQILETSKVACVISERDVLEGVRLEIRM